MEKSATESTDSKDREEAVNRLEGRSRKLMERIYNTYKTHYTMAEYYEKGTFVFNSLVALGTAALVVLLTWEVGTQETLVTIAVAIAIISWIQAALSLGKKSIQHYNTADRYHSLHQDFEDFVEVIILDDTIPLGEKREKFNSLDADRKNLNELTPRTTNFWHFIFNLQEKISDKIFP